MKNRLLLLLIALLSTPVFAQDCYFEINRIEKTNEEDERLTKEIVIARKVKRFNALPLRKVLAQLRYFDGMQSFVLKFPLTMILSPTFNDTDKDNNLVLTLENKDKVTLPLAKLMNNLKERVEFRYATDFVLFQEDIDKLKKFRITDIKVGMKNNTFDMKIEEPAAELLMESFHCIE